MTLLYRLLGIFALLFSCSAEIESPEEILDEIFSIGISPGISVPIDEIPESGHYGYYVPELTFTLPQDVYCDNTGAVPTENSSMQPGTTHTISQTTILRCVRILDSHFSAPIMRTYIFGRVPTLPIVSIAADPSDFLIYHNSTYGDYELPIHVDFFEKGKIGNLPLAWSYPAELGPMGNSSRAAEFLKRSVSVSFKEKHGQKNLKYRLFPDAPLPAQLKYKHFILRNNGNNWENDYIRDMLMTSLTNAQFGETPAKGLDIDYQKGRAVVVYYNGEYYGIHNMQERSNSDWFETNYNIDENYINLVKIKNSGTEISQGSDADYLSVHALLSKVSNLDDYTMETLKSKMDVDNFTNHFQCRIYYNDRDWPGNNMKVWNSTNSAYPKLRFFMHDTDHGFGSFGTDNQPDLTMMQFVTEENSLAYTNPPHSTLILRKLLTNKAYESAFINRFSLLIATYFAPARINARINELMADINDEIPYDVNHGPGIRPLYTIKNYANLRPGSMQSEITGFFNLDTPVDLTLSATGGGTVSVHGLQVLNNKATFKAYPNVPITLKAEGAGFKGWSDGGTAAERTETITSATTLTAKF